MSAFHWYESTFTVMSAGGVTTYVNQPAEHRVEMRKDAALAEWVEDAEKKDTIVKVVHRQAVAAMLEGVDARFVTAAKLAPATLDVAAPKTGTVASKEAAVQAKLATVLPVGEYEKLTALRATIVKTEPVEPAKEIQ